MPRATEEQLQHYLAAIRQRHGSAAIQKAYRPNTSLSSISTGFPRLDELLGIGGLPRSGITELTGGPTSGLEAIAFQTIANVQQQDEAVVLVDLEGTFDADYAAHCGVVVDDLLIVRDLPGQQILDLVRDVVVSKVMGLVILHSVHTLSEKGQRIGAGLRRLKIAVSNSPCALLFLTPRDPGVPVPSVAQSQPSGLRSFATLRLLVEREKWLEDEDSIRGYRTRVRVLKSHLAPSGQSTRIDILLPEIAGVTV